MSEALKVTLIQSDLVWENKKQNLLAFEERILSATTETDLFILPEMFTTGFSMTPELWAEPHLGETFTKMRTWAQTTKAAILGSIIVKSNQQFFNRAYFIFPDGTHQYYDKKHLFRMAKEDEYYTPGIERVLVEYKGWRIFPLICYDLRFPVWSRNDLDYDLLIYLANWPERRSSAWKTLLKARAIENLSYVAGVNRIGNDGNGIEHSGNSALIDFKGEELSQIEPFKNVSESIILNKEDLQQFRKKFPAHTDADYFTVK